MVYMIFDIYYMKCLQLKSIHCIMGLLLTYFRSSGSVWIIFNKNLLILHLSGKCIFIFLWKTWIWKRKVFGKYNFLVLANCQLILVDWQLKDWNFIQCGAKKFLQLRGKNLCCKMHSDTFSLSLFQVRVKFSNFKATQIT